MTTFAWTDGSGRPHTTHCGGAAVRLLTERGIEDSAFHVCNTESQRTELLAIIEALDLVPSGTAIHIYTDSQYAVQGFAGKWKLKANLDLWAQLRSLAGRRTVTLEWIARNSTSNHIAVDQLAKQAADQCV
jgi:ribonuclease HI